MRDYVECSECGYKSSRKDNYLDISLNINNINNLYDALYQFIKPELLSGNEKYNCSGCHRQVNAVKGKIYLYIFIYLLLYFYFYFYYVIL